MVIQLKKRSKIIIVVSLLLWISFIVTDYNRAKENKRPLFAIKSQVYYDGGTIEYFGLGYKVIEYNIIDNYETGEKGRNETIFGFWTLQK